MRGRIRLELTRNGRLYEVREATNAVMQAGGNLVAQLFAGVAKAGITHLGVGSSDTPETDKYATTKLTPDNLTGDTEAPIPLDAIVIEPPNETARTVKVRIRATLPASAAVGTVREAGLISRTPGTIGILPAAPAGPAADVLRRPPIGTPPGPPILYNRVTFAPLVKGNDHELTMFWEVTFPFGDLQELI
jgi:hypothetical protein